jgi:hypothetical protein
MQAIQQKSADIAIEDMPIIRKLPRRRPVLENLSCLLLLEKRR